MVSLAVQQHPSYPVLREAIEKYPLTAGALLQSFNDLHYVQHWRSLAVNLLEHSPGRATIQGYRTQTDLEEELLSHVVPCTLQESLSMSFLKEIFSVLDSPPSVYLAINATDSSIVYYKISTGIIKPSM